MLEKTLESPLDSKEIQPVHPEGDQSWMFIERTDAETPVLWPPHAKSWLIGKATDAGKDWGQEDKGNDRGWDGWMASPTRWAWVWVNSESWLWTGRPGVLQSWGCKELDTTEGLNWTVLIHWLHIFLQCPETLSELSNFFMLPAMLSLYSTLEINSLWTWLFHWFWVSCLRSR